MPRKITSNNLAKEKRKYEWEENKTISTIQKNSVIIILLSLVISGVGMFFNDKFLLLFFGAFTFGAITYFILEGFSTQKEYSTSFFLKIYKQSVDVSTVEEVDNLLNYIITTNSKK